ncbi:unnamed protein product, partial [Ectocarpus sp. 12 AP-2014]
YVTLTLGTVSLVSSIWLQLLYTREQRNVPPQPRRTFSLPLAVCFCSWYYVSVPAQGLPTQRRCVVLSAGARLAPPLAHDPLSTSFPESNCLVGSFLRSPVNS